VNKQDKDALKGEAKEFGRNVGNAAVEEAQKRLLPRLIRWVRGRIAARRAKR
jgi:hypothetical protein